MLEVLLAPVDSEIDIALRKQLLQLCGRLAPVAVCRDAKALHALLGGPADATYSARTALQICAKYVNCLIM